MTGRSEIIVDTDTVDRLRELLELPRRRPAKRSCLRCERRFDSSGVANRLCVTCKRAPITTEP